MITGTSNCWCSNQQTRYAWVIFHLKEKCSSNPPNQQNQQENSKEKNNILTCCFFVYVYLSLFGLNCANSISASLEKLFYSEN